MLTFATLGGNDFPHVTTRRRGTGWLVEGVQGGGGGHVSGGGECLGALVVLHPQQARGVYQLFRANLAEIGIARN